jgi:translation elongation factor EF-1beta
MTLYSLIEKVYARYSMYQSDDVDFDAMKEEIVEGITQYWPDIQNVKEGITFEFDGLYFDVNLDDYLKKEFYDKYPEALI